MRISGVRHPRTKLFFGAAGVLIALGGLAASTVSGTGDRTQPLAVAGFFACVLLAIAFVDRRIDDERADAALERRGVRATATVTEFSRLEEKDGSILGWLAVMTYRADGARQTARFSIPTERRHGLDVGSQVEVRYDPDHPETVALLG
jgi:hypothetical protein